MVKSTISLAIKFISFCVIILYSMHEMFIAIHTFASQSPNYNISNIHFSVVQNDPFLALFSATSKATPPILEIPYIGDRQVKVWIVMHT